MTTVLIRVKVLQGQEAAFEALMKQLVRDVHENEPDPKTYQVCRAPDEARTYVIFQSFADESAYDRYANSDYHLAASPKGLAMLDGDPVSEYLDRVD